MKPSTEAGPPVTRRGPQRSDAAVLAFLVLPSALSLVALLLFQAAEPDWSRPVTLLLALVPATVAALYQPLPGRRVDVERPPVETLGLGTLVLPALVSSHGALPAAVVAAVAQVLVVVLLRRLLRGAGSIPRILPAIEGALLLGLGVAAAGRVLDQGSESWRGPAAVVVYCTVVALSRAVLPAMRTGHSPKPADALPVLVDGAGWSVGWLLLAVARSAGASLAIAVGAVVVVLVAEAARHAILRRHADRRVDDFERLTEAHGRILAETSGLGGIAQQVLAECRHILPVEWFQFELAEGAAGPGNEAGSWAAGPDGVVVEGRPEPPPRPGMLPGIHRRVSWRRLALPLIPGMDGRPGHGDPDRPADAGGSDAESPEHATDAAEADLSGGLVDPEHVFGEATDPVEPLATVHLWCDPRRIEEGAVELLWSLVPQMASSVERARLDREARLDPLTGVPVRRQLESRLHRAFRRAHEAGTPLAAILCDVDHFKRVNDTWGHAAGDEALKLVAQTLDTGRRDDDLLCRWGGEEFTLLLERTDGEQALRLAERLRAAVEAAVWVWEGERIPLTMSLGVAAFPELTMKAPGELFLFADEALYEAKERGRNQCLLHCGKGTYRAPSSTGRGEGVANRS